MDESDSPTLQLLKLRDCDGGQRLVVFVAKWIGLGPGES